MRVSVTVDPHTMGLVRGCNLAVTLWLLPIFGLRTALAVSDLQLDVWTTRIHTPQVYIHNSRVVNSNELKYFYEYYLQHT